MNSSNKYAFRMVLLLIIVMIISYFLFEPLKKAFEGNKEITESIVQKVISGTSNSTGLLKQKKKNYNEIAVNKLLDVLKKEGYILNYETQETKNKIKIIYVSLKYYDGQPVIREIKRISKPGRRVYSRANSIPKVMNGLGLAILSTPKGVMSDTEARKNNVGGEIICRVF